MTFCSPLSYTSWRAHTHTTHHTHTQHTTPYIFTIARKEKVTCENFTMKCFFCHTRDKQHTLCWALCTSHQYTISQSVKKRGLDIPVGYGMFISSHRDKFNRDAVDAMLKSRECMYNVVDVKNNLAHRHRKEKTYKTDVKFGWPCQKRERYLQYAILPCCDECYEKSVSASQADEENELVHHTSNMVSRDRVAGEEYVVFELSFFFSNLRTCYLYSHSSIFPLRTYSFIRFMILIFPINKQRERKRTCVSCTNS